MWPAVDLDCLMPSVWLTWSLGSPFSATLFLWKVETIVLLLLLLPLLHLTAIFSRWTWVSQFLLKPSSSTFSGRETLGNSGTGYFMSWISFLPTNHQCLSVTQSTEGKTKLTANPVQWPGLIRSSSTTGILMEGHCCFYDGFPTPGPFETIIITQKSNVSKLLHWCNDFKEQGVHRWPI